MRSRIEENKKYQLGYKDGFKDGAEFYRKHFAKPNLLINEEDVKKMAKAGTD